MIRQIASHSRIEGNEKTPCLPRDRIAKIHANIGAWIKGDEPTVWKPKVEKRSQLQIADVSFGRIARKTYVVTREWFKKAARTQL
jgi:hypothetical protein